MSREGGQLTSKGKLKPDRKSEGGEESQAEKCFGMGGTPQKKKVGRHTRGKKKRSNT